MNRKRLVSTLLLLLASIIWGFAMAAQSVGAALVGPCTFVFLRFLLGAIVLAPVSLLVARKQPLPIRQEDRKQARLGGLLCGLFLGFASLAQQAGLSGTSAGKAGFITALYIILVPLAGLFLGRKPQKKIWLCAALGLLGLYCISVTERFTVGLGDALEMLCAIIFTAQILCIDRFSGRVQNPVLLAAAEFSVASFVGLIGMLLFEKPLMEDILAAWLPLVYAGVLSGAVGYTLQILGQKHVEPAVATLLMSLEAVFSALAGWLLLGQTLTLRELLGCALVFAAVLLAQLPVRLPRQKAEASDPEDSANDMERRSTP